MAVVVAGGCASSGAANQPIGVDGGSGTDGTAGDDGGMTFGDGNDDVPFSPDSGCATGNYKAQYAPAAMLVVLDGSGTMAASNKYASAQQAIVSAIDQDAFDSASLGLLIYPTGNEALPQDCGFIPAGTPVTCTVSGLAQVPLALAGSSKSADPSGVRHQMYQQLAASAPNVTGLGDGNPSYDAIQNAINILQAWPQKGKRILFFITDGGASCASLSTRGGYEDANTCNDWEYPSSIVSLVLKAHADANAPVNTIFVGVPGADTSGSDPTTQPPYHVRLALSAEGWAGSPETCDPACNGQTFSQTGGDPSKPCHFDMTVNYSPQILANAISSIRGKLLGCVFDVPQPDGGLVDPNKVNVEYATDGMTYTPLKKRSSSSDPCTTDGCWDYTPEGKIELHGKACSDVQGAPDADVQIVVGCQTVIK